MLAYSCSSPYVKADIFKTLTDSNQKNRSQANKEGKHQCFDPHHVTNY